MKLHEAEEQSAEIVELLKPFCKKILVVGSIRRKKPECKDIDILAIPSDYLRLHGAVLRLGVCTEDGPKLTRVFHSEIQVEVYYATEESWGTLVLIRTGSIESNRRLSALASKKNWRLKANGEGLIDLKTGKKIAGDEESIFAALGLKYLKPEQRS